MIPNSPLLQTPIRHSGLSSSFYNPHTLILKINNDSHSTDENSLMENSLQYNSTLIHEWIHWIQHQGTSFGSFLHSLRFTQQQTALSWLRKLPQEYLKNLIEKRKKGNESIIKLKNNQLEHQKFSMHSNHLNLLGQMWLDLQWVYQFLNNSNIAYTCGMPTSEIFGDSISDVYLYYILGNRSPSISELMEIRQWYRFDKEELNFTKNLGNLTTHTLMECGATISELQFLNNNLKTVLSPFLSSQHFESRINLLKESSYGVPLKVFYEFTGREITLYNLGEMCATLNILIFVALNPPVPPNQLNEPDYGTWSWFDIYPPIRFIKAIQTIEKIGLIHEKPNHIETKNYIDKICEISELPIILDNTLDSIETFRNINFSDNSFVCNSDNPNFGSYDYTHWVQKEFGKLRTKSIHFLTNFGNCTTGRFSIDFIDLLVNNNNISFSQVPIEWTERGTLGFRSDKREFSNILIRDLVFQYCLYDFLVGQGNYDLQAFPTQISQSQEFLDMANDSIYHSIVNTRNK